MFVSQVEIVPLWGMELLAIIEIWMIVWSVRTLFDR
jgi:hypothetical protein